MRIVQYQVLAGQTKWTAWQSQYEIPVFKCSTKYTAYNYRLILLLLYKNKIVSTFISSHAFCSIVLSVNHTHVTSSHCSSSHSGLMNLWISHMQHHIDWRRRSFLFILDYNYELTPMCRWWRLCRFSQRKVLLRMPWTIVSSSMTSLCIWNRIWCWFVQ